MHRCFRSSFLLFVGLCLFIPSTRVRAAQPGRRTVVMVSLDGLAGFYLDDPKAELPALRQLAKDGVRAASMKAVNPTSTWPNHATLATGDYPARHGVLGNNVYDRDKKTDLTLISDPDLDAGRVLKVPTIYDHAKAAGLKTIALRWPVTRAAKGLDLCLPDMSDDTELLRFATPGLIERGKKAGIFDSDDFVPADPNKHPQVKDEAVCRLAEMVLREDKPDLLLVHLIDVDHTQHEHGPRSREAYAAVHAADAFVARIEAALNAAAPGRGTLVIVSDHGFSSIDHQILPNVILRDAGLMKVVGVRPVKGSAVTTVSQGGADFIYVNDPAQREAVVPKVVAAFKDVPGIEKVLTPPNFAEYGTATPKDNPWAPDVILLGQMGYIFGTTSNGSISVVDKPERRGTHGFDADFPDLHATFVAAGAGLRAGVNLGEIRNVDVAPTVAKLLGVDMPNTDGKPIEAILQP